jgi:hypothetical protein
MTHSAFSGAKQRLFMSATLGEGGELERITGVKSIFRLPTPPGWDNQGTGRRLFLFPGWSLGSEEEEELQAQLITRAGRALILVPDDKSSTTVRDWISEKLGVKIFTAKEIEASKAPFIETSNAVAVVANRYDGIDFPKDECRLLILRGLPTASNLQERFLVARMGAVILLNDRILTRIVQAFGRCTRDATDYSAVVVSGGELLTYLLTREHRLLLHPELQAELEFGIEQSKSTDRATFIDNFDQFLQQTNAWREADGGIVAIRQALTQHRIPGAIELRKAVGAEISYEYALWHSDYLTALEESRKVLSVLSTPELRGYRALWLYLAGSAAWLACTNGTPALEATAQEYFTQASSAAPGVRWIKSLGKTDPKDTSSNEDSLLSVIIERLEQRLTDLGTLHDRKYAEEEGFILNNIDERTKDLFEPAHERLGRFLGFDAGKKESKGSPDPWWIVDQTLCFIFEDHSNAEATSSLDVSKARQAATHPNWVHANLPLNKDAEIVSILVTPVKVADWDALPHLSNVAYWDIDSFRQWGKDALKIIRELRRDFPGAGDQSWRDFAMKRYRSLGMDPRSLQLRFRSSNASEILRPKEN